MIKRWSLVLTLENFFAACQHPMLEALLHIQLIHLELQNAEVYSQRQDWNKGKKKVIVCLLPLESSHAIRETVGHMHNKVKHGLLIIGLRKVNLVCLLVFVVVAQTRAPLVRSLRTIIDWQELAARCNAVAPVPSRTLMNRPNPLNYLR